ITYGTANDGSFTWRVPGNFEPRNDYYISIKSVDNRSVWDTNGDFEIGYPNISLIGHTDTPDEAWDVAVESNYAYVADDYAGLRIINITDPAYPREESFY